MGFVGVSPTILGNPPNMLVLIQTLDPAKRANFNNPLFAGEARSPDLLKAITKRFFFVQPCGSDGEEYVFDVI